MFWSVTVDQRDPTPLHQQLSRILRSQIQAGEITDMLPSEGYLREQYGVSRGTVRRALETLVAEGLVYKITARGTFVSRK